MRLKNFNEDALSENYKKSEKIMGIRLMIYYIIFIAIIFNSIADTKVTGNIVQEKAICDAKNTGPYWIINHLKSNNTFYLSPEKKNIILKRWETAITGANNANRPIPILESIPAKETALIVIDMQKAFLDIGASIEIPDGRKIIDNINAISNKMRDRGGLVIFFRYIVDGKNDGLLPLFEKKSYLDPKRLSPIEALKQGNSQFELHSDLSVNQSKDIIMNKNRYSAVLGSNIVDVLRKKRIQNVIVTGVSTDVCAGNTAESLMQEDFNVIMVWDGTAALDRLEHEIYLARIFGLYGDVMPTFEVIDRIY